MSSPKSPDSNPVPAQSQRRTRWGPESQVTTLNGLRTAITKAMTPEQLEAYATHFRIEEIGQKMQMQMQDGPPSPPGPKRRSPSPAPEYDASGRRTNTRRHRHRQRLEAERRALVGAALRTIPGYQRPRDLSSSSHHSLPAAVTTKVYIPARDFPGTNFIGQILGPRGQSLAAMSEQSGAHIAIRGKGSVKEGRAGHRHNTNAATNNSNDQHEPLHCLITAATREQADHASRLVGEVIAAAACSPEGGQNERKRAQLRQLAVLNGTFRDDEGRVCEHCGEAGHRRYFCPMPARFSAGVTCRACNGAGHIARDCPEKKKGLAGPAKLPPWRVDRLARQQAGAGPDAEFEQLLLELGG